MSAFPAPAVRPRDSELVRIVCVNEEIKAIVATAFRINLMALNAIFLAKRAGRAALGFGVLSNELRHFAQDLTRAMGALREMTASSVSTVTGLMQQQRLNNILDAAGEACQGRAVSGLADIVRRGTARLQERRGRMGSWTSACGRLWPTWVSSSNWAPCWPVRPVSKLPTEDATAPP